MLIYLRFYRNELCFNQNTISDQKLKEFTLNNTDKSIISLWENILNEARKTKNYNNVGNNCIVPNKIRNNYIVPNEITNNCIIPNKKNNNENEKRNDAIVPYGLYQIIQELNTYFYNWKSYTKDELKSLNLNKTEKKAVSLEYVELNTKIEDLKKFLKEYYKSQIQEKLFEYELLK